MSEIIKSEIQLAIEKIYSLNKVAISEDKAFSHMLLKYYFGINFYEQVVTDGPNDGGIDFLHYDEEDEKVIVCQAKYTASLSCEDINAEFNKMHSTVENFMRSNTGAYNNILKQTLQDAIDRLPDDNSGNVEYRLFTIADIDTDTIKRKIEKSTTELGRFASQRNCIVSPLVAPSLSLPGLYAPPSVRFPTRYRNTISNACSLQSAPSFFF